MQPYTHMHAHRHTHTHNTLMTRSMEIFLQNSMSVQFSSVAQSCPTRCDPMNHSTPGLPIHHQLLESTQTHVHRVGDATHPSHPLPSPSPALNFSQHQGLHDVMKSPLCIRWPKYCFGQSICFIAYFIF